MSKSFYDSLSEITKLSLIANSLNSDLEAGITKRNIPKVSECFENTSVSLKTNAQCQLTNKQHQLDIASNLKSKFGGQR